MTSEQPDTWDLAWCWPCKRDHPLEPVHEETDCPRKTDRHQCFGAVYNGSLSVPERCAFEAGHDGRCEP